MSEKHFQFTKITNAHAKEIFLLQRNRIYLFQNYFFELISSIYTKLWNELKKFNLYQSYLILKKTPSKMFNRVLREPMISNASKRFSTTHTLRHCKTVRQNLRPFFLPKEFFWESNYLFSWTVNSTYLSESVWVNVSITSKHFLW